MTALLLYLALAIIVSLLVGKWMHGLDAEFERAEMDEGEWR